MVETVAHEAMKIHEEVVKEIEHKAEEIGWLVRKDAISFIDNDACREIIKLLSEVTSMVNYAWEATYRTPTGESFRIKEQDEN
jgi:hydrogenase maturation factor